MAKPKKPSKFPYVQAISENTGLGLDPKSARQSAGAFLTEDPNLLEEVLASKRVPDPKPDVPVAKRAPGVIDDAMIVGGKSIPKSGLMSFLGKHGGKLGLAAGAGAALYAALRDDKPNVSEASKPAGSDENKAPEQKQPETIDDTSLVPSSQKVEEKALERNFEMPELKFDPIDIDIGTREGPSEQELTDTARSEADKQRNYALLTRMGSQLGKAIAGGTYEIDDSAAKLMDENAVRLEQRAKADIEMQDNDPTSPASRLYKQIAISKGYNIKGDVSGKVLKELLPQFEAQRNAELNRQLQLEQMIGNREDRRDAREDKAEQKVKDRHDKFVTVAEKRSAEEFAPYQKVNRAKQSIEQNFDAIRNGANPGPRDVSILYEFIKLLDPESAVRDSEIELTQKGMSILESAGIRLKKIGSSALLSPSFRQGVLDIAKQTESSAKQQYKTRTTPLKAIAKQRGIPEERFGEFDPLLLEESMQNELTPKTSNSSVSTQVNELIQSRSDEDNKKRLLELRAKPRKQ